MSTLSGSAQFIWDTKNPLGQGATCIVCVGRNKKSGKQVAVKCFTHHGNTRDSRWKMREFDVLRKVQHENIVTLLAIEEEQISKSPVIIMELCTGGSVQNMLDKPAYFFGFPENEFLIFLKHIAMGMNHLWEKGIVHRDIKPGNILRYIADDGRSIYKLTDFGAARELPEGDTFDSIYGTEEFLHPMMLKGVMGGNRSTLFTATIDMWSLGVTLYHVLTGRLPFKPYGGKGNRATMYHMTTSKEYGVISGYQESEDGGIIWSRDLPKSCQLSPDLRRRILPMLAGLLETNESMCWKFETFFTEVKEIIDQVVVHLFRPKTFELMRLYVEPNTTLSPLRARISECFSIPGDDQLLLFFNNMPLSSHVKPSHPASRYPESLSRDNPIVVMDTDSTEQIEFQDPIINSYLKFGSTLNLETDPALAKHCLAVMTWIKREAADTILKQRLLHEAVNSYASHIRLNVENLWQSIETAAVYATAERHRLQSTRDIIRKIADVVSKHCVSALDEAVDARLGVAERSDAELSSRIESIESRGRKLVGTHVDIRELNDVWDCGIGSSNEVRCVAKIAAFINECEKIAERFKQDKNRTQVRLPYNEEQIHKFEKNNLFMYATKARTCLMKDCMSNAHRIHRHFHAWCRKVVDESAEITDVRKQLVDASTLSKTLTKSIDDVASLNVSELLSNNNQSSPSSPSSKHQTLNHGILSNFSFQQNDLKLDGPSCTKPTSPSDYSVISLSLEDARKRLFHINTKTDECVLRLQSNNELLGSMTNRRLPYLFNPDSCIEALIQSPLPQADKYLKNGYLSNAEYENRYVQSLFVNRKSSDLVTADGWTALHNVALSSMNSDNISVLVERMGLDVNALTNELATPLHLCCIRGSLPCVDVLLGYDVDVNATDQYERTPLMYACISSNKNVVYKLLNENSDAFSRDIYGNTCLHYASMKDLVETVTVLVRTFEGLSSIANSRGETGLHIAASLGFATLFDVLASCCDIAECNIFGETPFHLAAKCGKVAIVERILSSRDVDVNSRGNGGMTALMYACKLDHKNVVDLLLGDNRVNVNLVDGDGYTAVMHAVSSCHDDIVNTLLTKNVVLTMRSVKQETAFHIACQKHAENIIYRLLQHKNAQSAINVPDCSGKTMLHELAAFANVELIKVAVELGSNPKIGDKTGRLPADIAESSGNMVVTQYLCGL